jgi:hypothetical protein
VPKVFSFLNVTYHDFSTMTRLFREGWAANRVQTFMSGIGPGYRRSTVQAVRRKVLNLVKNEARIKLMSGTKRPSKRYIEEMKWEKGAKYKVFGSVDAVDLDTGETKNYNISMYTNDFKSKNQYLSDMSTMLDLEGYGVNVALINIEMKQLQHRQDLPY